MTVSGHRNNVDCPHNQQGETSKTSKRNIIAVPHRHSCCSCGADLGTLLSFCLGFVQSQAAVASFNVICVSHVSHVQPREGDPAQHLANAAVHLLMRHRLLLAVAQCCFASESQLLAVNCFSGLGLWWPQSASSAIPTQPDSTSSEL
jgi:hypothetical protein